jgi:hypothetical protein
LIGVVVLIASLSRPKEPEYQGKKLSWWVGNLYQQNVVAGAVKPNAAAATAIQVIGTNAVPCLVRWINYDMPSWQTRLVNRNVPDPLLRLLLRREIRARDATVALTFLGDAAIPAVPYLGRRLDSTAPDGKRKHVGDALLRLAEQGTDISAAFPAILRADTKLQEALMRDKSQRSWNIESFFGEFVIRANCFRMLTNCVFDPDPRVRDGALRHLRYLSEQTTCYFLIGPEPEAPTGNVAARAFLSSYGAIGTNSDASAVESH